MSKKSKIIKILIALLVVAIFIYQAPDESYWLENDPQDAIEIGKTYAQYLFRGCKRKLLDVSIDPAKTKIEKSNFEELSLYEIFEKLEKIHFDPTTISDNERFDKHRTVSPLYPEDQDMKLTIFDRRNSFIVMTFAYEKNDKIVEIPENGKMLFAVGIRYSQPVDNRLFSKMLRKIANIYFVRNFTGKMGTTGRWVLFDYKFKYNRNDYLNWVLNKGENWIEKNRKRVDASLTLLKRDIKDKKSYERWRHEIDARVNKRLNLAYEWGSSLMEKQIERVENSDNEGTDHKINAF